MNTLSGRVGSVVVGVSAAVVIVTLAVGPFLTPQWIAFEQGRSNATAWTGYTSAELRTATDAILADLVIGPPDFDVEVRGEPVLAERERGHMRDVRSIFVGLWVLAAVSIAVLIAAVLRRNRHASWRAVRRGALGLIGAVILVGAVALVAFDALFELFHRIAFPAGSYTFDPTTERLVQLFPFQFWQETTLVVGVVIIAISSVAALVGGRRATGRVEPSPAPDLTATPEPSR